MNNLIVTNVFLYARISNEDNLKKHSIENQIEIILHYAKKNNFNTVEIFIDDGYSGMNLNRPEYQRMLELLKFGKVKTFLTKDLSRLGRNYLEVGNLLEKDFKENHIRYIAINDNIDTNEELNDFVYIKSILNELYAKDHSRKLKQVYQRKAKITTLSKTLPYGYQFKENTKEIIRNPTTSKIVAYIFEQATKEISYAQIARDLTDKKIFNPGYYRYVTTGHAYGISQNKNIQNEKTIWKYNMIKTILSREEYTGKAINHRKISIRGQEKEVEPAYWTKIDDIFPPIIMIETFNKVNISRAKPKNPNTPKIPHLTKIVVGEEDKTLVFQTVQGKYAKYYNQKNYKENIKADFLHQIVFTELNDLLAPFYENEQQFIQKLFCKLQGNRKDEFKLEDQKNSLIQKITLLFESRLIGNISKEHYQEKLSLLNKELESVEEQLKEQNTVLKKQVLDYKIKEFIKLLKSSKDKENFELVYHLVDKIKVTFQSKTDINIEIQYKFITM